jgi:transposase
VRGPIPLKTFGSGLAALVATLVKVLDGATRKVRAWLDEAVGLDLSEASIVSLCAEAGAALQPYRDEALRAIRQARVVGLDETRWMDNGVDCTAWVADDRLGHVVVSIQPDRSGVHADELLGPSFDGVIVTDRYSGYDHLPIERRGVCHGHLTRNFQRLVDSGSAKRVVLGQTLLAAEWQLFHAWHLFKQRGADPPARERLRRDLEPVKADFWVALTAARRDPALYEMARDLFKVWPALWTFVEVDGVEPTNNETERVLRPIVLARKIKFGTWSESGKRFLENAFSAVAACQAQGRSLFQAIAQGVAALRLANSALAPPHPA